MAPNTRTSCTSGKDAAGASSSRSCDSMAFTFSCHPLSNRSETDADAIAHANGFPMKVGPCMKQPASPLQIISATGVLVTVADSVM